MGETVGVGRLLGGAVASVATTTSASTKVGNEAMNEATIAGPMPQRLLSDGDVHFTFWHQRSE